MPIDLRAQVLGRFVRLEQPEEEEAQRRGAAHRPVGTGLTHPATHFLEACIRDLVRLRAARLAGDPADQPFLAQPRELGVDLEDRAGEYDFALEARTMYEATNVEDKQLELLPGTAHGIALLSGSAAVRGMVERFLSSH